jgi:hypothetical protein
MKPNIKDYSHLYLGCEMRMFGDLNLSWSKWRKMTPSDLNLILNYGREVQLALRPLSSITEDDFYSFFNNRESENEVMIKATVNNLWCVGFYDKEEYQQLINEELSIEPKELLYDLEESDFDNVIGVGKKGSNLAYGCSEEMRYFVELPLMAAWINHLRKRGIDCDGLITAGLAIDKTTLKV